MQVRWHTIHTKDWSFDTAYVTHVLHCQVSLLQEQLQGRKQRGEVKKNAAGEVTDRESRLLLYQINSMMRPINFDEEESNTLQDSQARFLLLCITNYRRLVLHLLAVHMWLCTALLMQKSPILHSPLARPACGLVFPHDTAATVQAESLCQTIIGVCMDKHIISMLYVSRPVYAVLRLHTKLVVHQLYMAERCQIMISCCGSQIIHAHCM